MKSAFKTTLFLFAIFGSVFFLVKSFVSEVYAQSCATTGTYHIHECVPTGDTCSLRLVQRSTSCQRGEDQCRAHVLGRDYYSCDGARVETVIRGGEAFQECVGGSSGPVDYWTHCSSVPEENNCCKSNCPAANRQGSCTLPSGNSGYNCPKSCESNDDDGGDPTLCKAPRICWEDLVRCVWVTEEVTKKSGKTETRKKKVCEYRELCKSGESTCVKPTDCNPARCPAGTSEVGTGDLVTTKKCSYLLSGRCDANNNCRSGERTRRCYALVGDPPILSDDPIKDNPGTTVLGCSIGGRTGQEINNEMAIQFDVTDPVGSVNNVKAFMLWLGTDVTPPNITQIASSGTPLLQSNGSFGFMVGNYGGSWRVFAPRYNSSGTWDWINLNSTGSGERGRVRGETGKDLAIIKDVVVSDVDSDTKRVTAKLEVLHSGSGVSNFESADVEDYKIFIAGMDTARWVQGTASTMAQPAIYSYVQDWTVDLEAPIREDISHTVATADRLNLNWNFDDQSGILRVVGDAEVASGGEADGPIDDITSGISNYELGSGDNGSQTYGGHHLWSSSVDERSDLIDIRDNEGGSIDFKLTAFDRACNAGEYIYNMELGEPWIITKGGVVFSANGTDIAVKSFTEHERFSDDSYWSGDFGFYKDESDLSTELLSGGGSALNTLINNVKLSSVRAQSYNDRNNRSEYWFDELSRRYSSMLASDPERFTSITIVDDLTTLDSSTSQIVDPVISSKQCNTGTSCVVEIEGDLNIESGYSCNTRTIFIVDGNINIQPDMTTANKRSGCMFISRGDITLDAGSYKSGGSSYPKYDVVEGFFITDGQILIPEVDQDEDVRDGLKVNGSLIAFGGAGEKSVSMRRTLKLIDNNAFPALAVHFDNRYLNFATTVFGGQTEAFKREVGFKPL